MKPWESSEAAELNADHGQMNPRFSARFGALVVSYEASLAHQPAKGSLDNPAPGQDRKSLHIVRAFDDLNLDLGPTILDPGLEILSGVAAIDPNLAQLGEPSGGLIEHWLRHVTFGAPGGSHYHSQQQTQGINQHVALSPLDPFACIVADLASVTVGFDALAVEDGGRGLLLPLLSDAHTDSQGVVERGPSLVQAPGAKDVINRLPPRIGRGHLAPRNTSLENLQDGIDDSSPVGRRSAIFFSSRKHGLEELPLRVGQIGIVEGVFHRPNCGSAENGKIPTTLSCQCHSITLRRNPASSPNAAEAHSPSEFTFSDRLLCQFHMKVILFGGTGMVGQGVLRECLRDPEVTEVLAVTRSATGQ